MNILIVHNKYQLVGGEDAVANNEGELLRKYGNKVLYYYRENSEIREMNIVQKIKAIFGTIFSFKTYFEVNKIIKENNIEVIHVHNTVPLISLSIYYVAKKNRCRLVQSIHNMRMLCPAGTMLRNNKICEDCINKSLICAIKHKCYRGSFSQTFILTLSMGLHRLLKSYLKVDAFLVTTKFNYEMNNKVIPSNKLFYKPYCLNVPVRNLNNKKRDYYIYISRLEYMKGIQVALEAFKELPNQKLLVLGVGPDEEKSKKYVLENNMKNIVFLGFKNLEEMRDLLYDAKALIFPTQWYEGFPMTLVESFALGTPIIGSNIGNVGSIIKDNETGLLFRYDSSKSLIEKTKYFDENSNLAKAMEQNSQKYYLDNHKEKSIYDRTIKIYSNKYN